MAKDSHTASSQKPPISNDAIRRALVNYRDLSRGNERGYIFRHRPTELRDAVYAAVGRSPSGDEERANDLRRIAEMWDELYGVYCLVGLDRLVEHGHFTGQRVSRHPVDSLEVLLVSGCQETQVETAKRFLELFPRPEDTGIVDTLLKRSLEHGRPYDNTPKRRASTIEAARRSLEQERTERI